MSIIVFHLPAVGGGNPSSAADVRRILGMPQVTLRLRICGVCYVILSYVRELLKRGESPSFHNAKRRNRAMLDQVRYSSPAYS